MIEEPYRWVEAIKNRREYIEDQLGRGSPIVLMNCADGLLLLTVSSETRKVFEIYDRIAFAALGHPADIERMRLVAIDLAHIEGFNRAVADVSLRRLVNFGMSPVLKNAFEQVFAAPFIVRMLLVELGESAEHDFIVKLDYDGSFGRRGTDKREPFEVVAGSEETEAEMLRYLVEHDGDGKHPWPVILPVAAKAWAAGMRRAQQSAAEAAEEQRGAEKVEEAELAKLLKDQLKTRHLEAALLDRQTSRPARFRLLDEKEVRAALKDL